MWCQEMSISAIEGIGNSWDRWAGGGVKRTNIYKMYEE